MASALINRLTCDAYLPSAPAPPVQLINDHKDAHTRARHTTLKRAFLWPPCKRAQNASQSECYRTGQIISGGGLTRVAIGSRSGVNVKCEGKKSQLKGHVTLLLLARSSKKATDDSFLPVSASSPYQICIFRSNHTVGRIEIMRMLINTGCECKGLLYDHMSISR